jgi:hypothetical protein
MIKGLFLLVVVDIKSDSVFVVFVVVVVVVVVAVVGVAVMLYGC